MLGNSGQEKQKAVQFSSVLNNKQVNNTTATSSEEDYEINAMDFTYPSIIAQIDLKVAEREHKKALATATQLSPSS